MLQSNAKQKPLNTPKQIMCANFLIFSDEVFKRYLKWITWNTKEPPQ